MSALVKCSRCEAPNEDCRRWCRRCGELLPADLSRLALQPPASQQASSDLRSPGSDPLLDSRVGDYRVVELLGRGGMGIVYRAEELSSGQSVALKTVLLSDPKLLPRIRREIQALSRLRHPGIVRILSSGIHEGLPWYAMELLGGATLRRAGIRRIQAPVGSTAALSRATIAEVHLRRTGSWWTRTIEEAGPQLSGQKEGPDLGHSPATAGSPDKPFVELRPVLTVMRRLCLALAYLHGEGIVHKDLKPGNVLVRSDGWPVLVDFGLAGQFAAGPSREVLELDGAAAGTVAYMAPEQIRGELPDARTDLYSLGCVLYELLTGRSPFVGRTSVEVLELHLRGELEPPSSLVSELSPEVDALVLRLLEKEPRRRFGYADDVAAALARLGAEDSLEQQGPRPRLYLYRPGFSGRDEPMRGLEQRLERLQEQDEGGVVLLGGESGVGKTRLLLELAREAAQRRLRVLGGECQDGARRPLDALRKPLQAVADRCRTAGVEETERLLGKRGPVLARYEPMLAALPGQERYPEPTELPAASAQLRLHAYLAETFGAFAEEEPLALLLDDLQWADELTIRFLEHVGRASGEARGPLLVVGAYRTEELGEPLRNLLDSKRVEPLLLGRLEESAVAAMVGDMLALEPAPALFSRFLARQSEGNPFFVAEYLRAAVEEGLLSRDEQGLWQVAKAGKGPASDSDYEALRLPHSVRELVGRRLESLSSDARHLAEAGSVLGRELEERLLGAVSQMRLPRMQEAVQELLRRQVLEEAGAGFLRFAHDKLREVAYAGISLSNRRALHQAAAEAMAASPTEPREEHLADLGQHWEEAGVQDKARECYLSAARRAKERYVHAEAERLYRAYLRLSEPSEPERIAARNELGSDVLRFQGRMAEALEEHGRALDEARRMGVRGGEAESLRKSGDVHRSTGRNAEALRHYEQALLLYRETGDHKSVGRALSDMGACYYSQGQMTEARTYSEQALPINRQTGDRLTEANTLNTLGALHYHQRRLADAQAMFEQALSIHREEGLRTSEGSTLANLAIVLCELDQLERAGAVYQQALLIQRDTGNRPYEAITLSNLGHLRRLQGQPEEAQSLLEQALHITRTVQDRRSEAQALHHLGILRHEQDRLEEACALLEQALERLREIGSRLGETELLADLGEVYEEQGRLEEARSMFEQALSLRDDAASSREVARIQGRLACLERRQRADLERAGVVLLDAEKRLSTDPSKLFLAELLAQRCAIALSRGQNDRESLERVRAVMQGLEMGPRSRLRLAVTRLERAVAAFEAGQHERLFRGELIEDLPEGLRRALVEAGQLTRDRSLLPAG